MAIEKQKRPRIGLALGGGMARGTAHIGVLRVLEKHGIPIDLIAGTSVGSLVGGAYAAGLNPDQIQDFATTVRWSDLGRVTVSRLGFYSNARTEDYVRSKFPVTEFDKLRMPFGAVAADIQSGKMIVFTEGSLPLAIRASCAMPIYYVPVPVNGRMLVDGGVVGHLPASVARIMGADIVIAIDVNSQHNAIAQPTNMFTIMSQSLSIMGRSTVSYLYQDADVVIIPKIGHIRGDDLTRAAEMIEAGEKATELHIHRIRKLIEPGRQGFLKQWFGRREHDVRKLSRLS
jgi:NTE family protein